MPSPSGSFGLANTPLAPCQTARNVSAISIEKSRFDGCPALDAHDMAPVEQPVETHVLKDYLWMASSKREIQAEFSHGAMVS